MPCTQVNIPGREGIGLWKLESVPFVGLGAIEENVVVPTTKLEFLISKEIEIGGETLPREFTHLCDRTFKYCVWWC